MISRVFERKEKLNNSGSTLITVMVAIAFVTVLASILMSTSVLDVRMKSIDRRMRNEFYYAEKGLNDVYTQIGQKVSEIAAQSYAYELKEYGGIKDAYYINTEYKKRFVSELYSYLKDVNDSLQTSNPEIQCTSSNGVRPTITWLSTNSIQKGKTDGTGYVTISGTRDDAADYPRTIMKNVVITSTDSNGFVSQISTDIVIDIPSLDFFGSNEDIGNYAIIASEGLSLSGNSSILGNVYSGVGKVSTNYVGGIAIEPMTNATLAGDYIVARGNIEIANGSTLEINSSANPSKQSNVWFETILVGDGSDANNNDKSAYKHAKLETYDDSKANFYALNDLRLEGNGSEVKIAGNYYGYNPYWETTVEYKNRNEADANDKPSSATNSAIMINGYGVSLDMSGINNLLVNGRAYIQMDNKEENPTAESLALKTNQQLYLLPTFFLNCTNPAVISISGNKTLNADMDNIKDQVFNYFKLNLVEKKEGEEWWADNLILSANGLSGNKIGLSKNSINIAQAKEVGGYVTEVVAYAYIPFKVSPFVATEKAYKWDDSKKIYEETTDTPGTKGTVDAKTAYFNTILKAGTEIGYSVSSNNAGYTIEPSPFTLNKQAFGSIGNSGYFDLKKCVVSSPGASASRIYAAGALVEYDSISSNTATPVDNTVGLTDIDEYKKNMYHRYRSLCMKLDGLNSIPVDAEITSANILTDEAKWWDSRYPVANIIDVDNLASPLVEGVDYTAYNAGKFMIGDTVNITSDYDGIIIANTINVGNNARVKGMLIAKKTINVNNGTIVADQGLIQRHIAKEIETVANDANISLGNDTTKGFFIKYLLDPLSNNSVKYNDDNLMINREYDFDYNNYMHYENWKKGQSN